jgi:hypothetical protein
MDTTTEVNTFEEIYMTNPMEGKKSIKEANLQMNELDFDFSDLF